MERKLNAIIFDLDGTLLDTLDDLADSLNMALESCGHRLLSREEVRSFIGDGSEILVRRALHPIDDDEAVKEVHKRFKTAYDRNLQNKTAPYPGISETLKKLYLGGIQMAVVSNKYHAAVVPLIKDCFGEYIGTAIGIDEHTPQKPDPTGTLRAISLLGCDKSDTAYIGDTDIDIATAKNAGLFAIGCSWGFRDRSVLEEAGADIIIDSPAELPGLFGL